MSPNFGHYNNSPSVNVHDMKRFVWPIAVIVLGLFTYMARHYQGGTTDTIEYRGEHFKMRKAYPTYEAYKDDPDNLDTNELARIEKAMLEARLPGSFASREEFTHAMFDLKFPGYGLGAIVGPPITDDGSTLFVQSVEIPQRDKERYFVATERGGQYILLDDFVATTASNAIRQAKLSAGKLFYYDSDGLVVREKEVTAR